jgi:hypothetical protein
VQLLEDNAGILLLKDTNPKTAYGLAKPGLENVPPIPLYMVGQVMRMGAEKYGPMNWRDDPVSLSTYYNATLRHLFEMWDGQDRDMDSLLPNLALAAANLFILMDAQHQGTLIDDRPTKGTLNTFIRQHTKGLPSNGDS